MTARELDDYAARQFGLVTRKQARSVLTRRQIDVRTGSGEWAIAREGVYRLRSAPRSWEGDLLARVIDRAAVASHRTAAVLWDLDRPGSRQSEITVPYHRRPRNEAGMHVTRQWDRRDEVERSGIACTGLNRTILDCAAVMHWRRVERLAEGAIRRDMTSWGQLRSTLIAHSAHGRDGCGRLRHLLDDRAATPGVTRSDFSLFVVNLLRRHGIPEPKVEYPVCDQHGEHILALDLAWPDQKKAWELDGLEWHFGRADVERDRRKRNRLVNEGWVLQEVLWSMYAEAPDDLVAMARRFLAI